MISEILINRLNGATRRIRERHTDDIGVAYIRSYNCALDADVNSLLTANAIKLEAELADSEAESASDTDNEIVAGDYADVALVVLKYLRKAYALNDSYESYKKIERFNNYRVSQGWAINQVVAHLSAVGLTQEEWDLMLARYSYLSNAQRVTAMENYQLVLNGDIWRAE